MFQLDKEPLLESQRFLALNRRVVARYLQIHRTVGSDFLNISELWAAHAGVRYRPGNGGCEPLYAPYDWPFLIDGNLDTFAHTGASVTARIWTDLGADHPVDRVGLTNRRSGSNVESRIVGSSLSLVNAAGVVVWQYPISQIVPSLEFALPPPTGNRFVLRLAADARTVRWDMDTAELKLGAAYDLGVVSLKPYAGDAGARLGYVALVTDDAACIRTTGLPGTRLIRGPFEPTNHRCFFQLIRMPGGFALAQNGMWVAANADALVATASNPLLFATDRTLDPGFLRDAPAPMV